LRFNFVRYNKIYGLAQYYDKNNIVALCIFISGWENKYHCVLEWGEYETTDHHLYSAEEIKKYYGVSTFLRKEKLYKINESMIFAMKEKINQIE
jgi:hypothetical protein